MLNTASVKYATITKRVMVLEEISTCGCTRFRNHCIFG